MLLQRDLSISIKVLVIQHLLELVGDSAKKNWVVNSN